MNKGVVLKYIRISLHNLKTDFGKIIALLLYYINGKLISKQA